MKSLNTGTPSVNLLIATILSLIVAGIYWMFTQTVSSGFVTIYNVLVLGFLVIAGVAFAFMVITALMGE